MRVMRPGEEESRSRKNHCSATNGRSSGKGALDRRIVGVAGGRWVYGRDTGSVPRGRSGKTPKRQTNSHSTRNTALNPTVSLVFGSVVEFRTSNLEVQIARNRDFDFFPFEEATYGGKLPPFCAKSRFPSFFGETAVRRAEPAREERTMT